MGKITFGSFVSAQWATLPPAEVVDLSGKTVMVVGANAGIGFEASKHFALMNPARLILACRSKSKGEAAVEELRIATGYKAELWMIDLSEFSSVIAFADRFEKDGGRLDYLIENAGMATFTYSTTKDGYESTLQVNCLSLFLLALRLLPRMIQTGVQYSTRPRLVIVESAVHHHSQLDKNPGGVLDSGNLYKTMSSQEYCDKHFAGRYDDSKLFDVFFHRALDDRLGPKSPVIVNGAHPGFCYSELRREFTGIMTIPMFLMERTFAWTSEQGSRQLLYAALGGAGQGKAVEDKFRGAYIAVQQISEASDFVLESKNLQDRHWRDVLDILVKVDPRVEEVVKKYLVPV